MLKNVAFQGVPRQQGSAALPIARGSIIRFEKNLAERITGLCLCCPKIHQAKFFKQVRLRGKMTRPIGPMCECEPTALE